MNERQAPLLVAETLVLGGSIAAVKAAIGAAAAGKNVSLVEPRTYLGTDLTACGRYWLSPDQWDRLRSDFVWADDGTIGVRLDDEVALVPDALKRALEDALIERRVGLVLAARPIEQREGRVLVAGKAGKFEIAAGAVVSEGDLPPFHARGAEIPSFVLEFSGVDVRALRDYEGRGAAGGPLDSFRVHRGHSSEGHALIEYRPRGDSDGLAVAAWLIGTIPGFEGARLATIYPEAVGTSPRKGAGHLRPHKPASRTVDVLVVGGGTSGVAAAIAAALKGARVLLAEMNHELGGTGTTGGVDSYWFGRRAGFNLEVTQRVEDVHRRLRWTGGKWCRPAKAAAWMELAREAGVEVLLDTVLVDPIVSSGAVAGAVLATPDSLIEVTATVTVDATGDGDVAARAGAEVVYGSEREGVTMWYSLAPHPRPGLTKNNFTSNVDVGDPRDYTRAILAGRRRYTGHDHGSYVAPRESRHIRGVVTMTLTDQLRLRQWPDLVNIAFSNHDVKGQTTSDWLRLGFLPPNLEPEVPYRALLPRSLDGLLVTGKAISVTHDGLPAVRMQADLENLGYATGVAAAMAAGAGVEPRDVAVPELQRALVAEGLLPGDVLGRPGKAPERGGFDEAKDWIARLDDATPIYDFAFMDFDAVQREPVPFVEVCTAGPAIVPLLREEAANPGSSRRLTVARALAWYGDQSATPVLLDAAWRQLEGGSLPYRGHIPCAVASPDHGAMPELAMLLHSLAMVRDLRALPLVEEVVRLLEPTDERLRDPQSGLFHYVDAVCDIAERVGSPAFRPVLEGLRSYDLLQGHLSQAPCEEDWFLERLGYLEIVINRAMARCGSVDGARRLAEYLADARRPLARVAHRELRLLSGRDYPADPTAWREWLSGQRDFEPQPWPGEREPYEPWLEETRA